MACGTPMIIPWKNLMTLFEIFIGFYFIIVILIWCSSLRGMGSGVDSIFAEGNLCITPKVIVCWQLWLRTLYNAAKCAVMDVFLLWNIIELRTYSSVKSGLTCQKSHIITLYLISIEGAYCCREAIASYWLIYCLIKKHLDDYMLS